MCERERERVPIFVKREREREREREKKGKRAWKKKIRRLLSEINKKNIFFFPHTGTVPGTGT